ncbi:hypothetical protein GGX14DRAFT_527599 [Mycena pura]|uniref:Uncharacterized protein n=1 Tax=Mycena pura TaxID=153505 RepID=A0AAD6UXE8_9AGAR|nr:hypothetical protein GGX14DRAFT_527599 [Mycena pura]
MAKRAASTSEKALKAAAVAAAEAKELEDGEKPLNKPRGRPKKPTPITEPVTEEALPDAKAALAQSIQEAKNVVIECIGSAPRCFSTLTLHADRWDFDLTWTLINAIEEDDEIQDGLFPGVGAIKHTGGQPKTHFYALLAKICFAKHLKYTEAYAKAILPKQLEAWRDKIKNRVKALVKRCREHITTMGETGAGMTTEDEILPGTALTTKWDLIKADSPWFFSIRTLIASRPNLQPVGLGNTDTEIDTSILLRTQYNDTSSNFDDYGLSSEGADLELPDVPDAPRAPLDISSDSSDDDIPDVPTLAGTKRQAPATTAKPETKKMKPAPATSIPAAAAAVLPTKNKSSKDRFSATIVAEEETHQRALAVKKDKNDARKEVALKKIEVDGEVRLAKARRKQVEKERKLDLARLKMEQEHQFRMAQLQTHAGPSSESMSFSGGGGSGGGGTSQDDDLYHPGLYSNLSDRRF